MALNRECLGKEYPEQRFEVKSEGNLGTKTYAKGYNDDNPWFLDESREGGVVAPPMYAVVYSGMAMAQGMFDSKIGANLARLVHGEQELKFHRLVRPGENLTTRAKVVGMHEKGTGELLEIGTETRDDKGELVGEGVYGFFIRGEKKDAKDTTTRPKEEEEIHDIVFSQEMKTTKDQTFRYADGSGDRNPIHMDDNFAKTVGLPGIILQGLCTMAFTSKAIMDEYLGRDPSRMKRIKVRFSKPVLPEDTVTTEAWIKKEEGDRVILGFESKNQNGVKVVKGGEAEVVK